MRPSSAPCALMSDMSGKQRRLPTLIDVGAIDHRATSAASTAAIDRGVGSGRADAALIGRRRARRRRSPRAADLGACDSFRRRGRPRPRARPAVSRPPDCVAASDAGADLRGRTRERLGPPQPLVEHDRSTPTARPAVRCRGTPCAARRARSRPFCVSVSKTSVTSVTRRNGSGWPVAASCAVTVGDAPRHQRRKPQCRPACPSSRTCHFVLAQVGDRPSLLVADDDVEHHGGRRGPEGRRGRVARRPWSWPVVAVAVVPAPAPRSR